MKKLIAQRPIQYMGRTYERGAAIPAQDTKMVAAWLKAGSATWVGDTTENVVAKAVQEDTRRSRVNDAAAEAIRAMGVTIEDAAGEFVGAASMEEQIRAIFAGGRGSLQNGGGEGGQGTTGDETPAKGGQEGHQDPPAGEGGQDENAAMGGQNAAEDSENGEGAGEGTMLTGHLDAADLEKWKKADLEKLAADMGVDISKAKNNAERAAILAAVEVQAPANDPENGGGGQ